MVVAKILRGDDNDSFMYTGNRPYCCMKCNYPTRQEANADFRLKKRRWDISYTHDLYLIVSSKFKQFCEASNFQNIVFYPLEKEKDFFFLDCTKVIPLDYQRREVQFIDFCDMCNRFAEVIGATPSYLLNNDFKIEPKSFYRSEYGFGSYDQKSPLIIVGPDVAKLLTAEKFRGLYFKDVIY